MDFTFSDEQTMLRDGLARLLDQHYAFDTRQQIVRSPTGRSEDVWRRFHDLGLLALPLPEAAGGLAGSIADVVAVAELFGAHLVVEPYVSTILLAATALAKCGDGAAVNGWLPRITSGSSRAAFAHEEGRGIARAAQIDTSAMRGDGGLVLNGTKRLVLDGDDADLLVVTARLDDGRPALVLVPPDAAGMSKRAYTTIDGRPAADLVFHDVALPSTALLSADAGTLIDDIVDQAIIALAAEAVGAMGTLLEMTASHAGTRKQFGVPIGSFQALAHRVADMKLGYTKARALLLYTTALAEAGRAARRDISLLKAQVGRLGRALAESAVQVHGGVGITDDLPVGHYLKRILAVDAMFGSGDHHFRVVGATAPVASYEGASG